MTLVKICGITNIEDALASIDAGADALGFNFYPRSARYISPASTRQIVDQLPGDILKIGVFVNEDSPEIVDRIAAEAGITGVQLHGDESPEYCKALGAHRVIKVFRVTEHFDVQVMKDYAVDAVMLDAFHYELRGGTGQSIDWDLAKEVGQCTSRLFLAGGLSPENVAAAVTTVRPYAVDACSALETVPGKKNVKRVMAFVRAVREAGS